MGGGNNPIHLHIYQQHRELEGVRVSSVSLSLKMIWSKPYSFFSPSLFRMISLAVSSKAKSTF